MWKYSRGGEKEEEEEEPEIYVRYVDDARYKFASLGIKRSSEDQICECGAQVQLKHLFERIESDPIQSSCAVFGSRIYLFGGCDRETCEESSEVAYIDVNCPEQGWKVCKNPMMKPQTPGYTFTYDDDRVVILHTQSQFWSCHDIIQVYYPHTDHWVSLTGGGAPSYWMYAHAVVDNGSGERFLLAHCDKDALYSFDVDKNLWDLHWDEAFRKSPGSAALVDHIYYVIDLLPACHSDFVFFSGYDIASVTPKLLPVEILPEECGKRVDEEWIPGADSYGDREAPTLLSLGNSKLAMIWHYICLGNGDITGGTRLVCCSIFKMIKSVDSSGGLNLLAQPLSKVSYHVEGYYIRDFLLVYPNKNMDFIAAKKRKIEEETSD